MGVTGESSGGMYDTGRGVTVRRGVGEASIWGENNLHQQTQHANTMYINKEKGGVKQSDLSNMSDCFIMKCAHHMNNFELKETLRQYSSEVRTVK